MHDAGIKRLLKPAKNRLLLRATLRAALIGMFAGLAAGVAAAIVSFFVPLEYLLFLVLALPATGFALGALAALLFLRPGERDAARALDRLGGQERAVTMLELTGRVDDFARLQRADAAEKLPRLSVKQISLRQPRWLWIASAAAAALVLISFAIPNAQRDILAGRAAERQAIKEQAEHVKKAAEKATDKATAAELKKLAEGLKNTKSLSDAMKQISKAQEKLQAQAQKQAAEASKALANGLGQSSAAKPLTDALKKADSKAFQKAASELTKALQDGKLSDDQKAGLQQALSAAASGVSNQSLSDALQAAASAMNGSSASAAEALNNALNAASKAASGQSGNAADADALLQQAKSQLGNSSSLSNNSSGQGQGQGQGQSNGNGNGNGQGSGSGQGQGQGPGGAGAGTGGGPDKENENANGYNASGSGVGQTPGSEKPTTDYEAIFDPDRLGGQDNGVKEGGARNGEGQSDTVKTGPGQGTAGDRVPYNQVVYQYQSEAAQAMDREDIPAGLRDWVERYFAALTQ